MLLDATAPVHHDDNDIDAWGAAGGGIVAREGGIMSGEGGGGASVSPPCNTHVGPSSPHHTTHNMTTMFAASFDDRDDADGTPLSSAAAGGEGGVDADRGFTQFAAAVPSFDATAAMGEEGMAVATTYGAASSR